MLVPSRPVLRLALALVLFGTIIGLVSVPLSRRGPYADELDAEREASQDADPEGRYVWFDLPPASEGQDRMLQHILLNYHLAFEANRSLVYRSLEVEQVPSTSWLPQSEMGDVPLSAYIGSVTSGFEELYKRPKAISFFKNVYKLTLRLSQYRSVCPETEEATYTISMTTKTGGVIAAGSGVATAYTHEELMNVPARCLHIRGEVFDREYLKTNYPVQLAPALLDHPTLQHFTFSRSVLSLMNDIMPTLAKGYWQYDLDLHAKPQPKGKGKAVHKDDTFKHILVLQLEHSKKWLERCTRAGLATEPFHGFNKLPKMPGNENVPPPADMVEASRLGLYTAKCLPEYTAIIQRARRMRTNHPRLRTVYILSDGDPEWVEGIRKWLQSDAWNEVYVGARDFGIEGVERAGVNTEIARRAGVFVGNGFSDTASLVALLRARDGVHPDLTQYW